ncbi:hypothetical protein ACXOL9_004755 [Vibrio parahaemolyticus]
MYSGYVWKTIKRSFGYFEARKMSKTVEIKLVTINDSILVDECMALCPFCDQPIMGGAIIVHHLGWGLLSLAHDSCLPDDVD